MQNRVSVWKEIREKKNKSDTQQNGGKNEGGDGSRFLRLFCCQNDRRKSLFSYNFSKLFFFMFYYSTTKTTRKNLLRHPSPPGERDSERDVRGKKETVMNSKFKKKISFFNNLSKKLDIYYFLFRNVIEKTNKFNSAISKIKKIFRIFLFGLWRKCQTIKVEEDQVETRGKRRKKIGWNITNGGQRDFTLNYIKK